MSGDREKLQAALRQLHEQLEALEHPDQELQAELRSALTEIQQALEGNRTAAEGEPPLTTRLSEAARQFEESHPMLFGNLGSVIDTLGRMGI
jgi:chromosome segregation ATPase